MPQANKAVKLEEINASLDKAKSVFLTDFSGLTVEEVTRLRSEFRKANVKYLVVKNTLARISAKEHGYDALVPFLNGPTAMAIAMDDPVAPVRIIFDFKKDKEKPSIKAAFLEGELLDQKSAEEVRNIPPREVLLAQVASAFAAPLSSFVGSLQAVIAGLANVLKQVQEKKEA
ncbi:MAG TPA: 50S ribosomal protein L10 [bacterium]|nr:50S ribosomal protein L10 [bacterium]HPR88499.1 50S ribosomal protein L10 [bacterium]